MDSPKCFQYHHRSVDLKVMASFPHLIFTQCWNALPPECYPDRSPTAKTAMRGSCPVGRTVQVPLLAMAGLQHPLVNPGVCRCAGVHDLGFHRRKLVNSLSSASHFSHSYAMGSPRSDQVTAEHDGCHLMSTLTYLYTRCDKWRTSLRILSMAILRTHGVLGSGAY